MRIQEGPGFRAVADKAAGQHGTIARWQLLALGVSSGAIQRLIAAGVLHPVHRGVYAVGHPRLTRQGRWMAAVLACGPDALLSHFSAAALYGIVRARPGAVEVMAPRGRKPQKGIRLHRPRQIHPEDRAVEAYIPVVSIPRLLLDIGNEKIFEDVIRLRLLDVPALERALERRPTPRIRRLLDEQLTLPQDTRVGLEQDFARFCRKRGIRTPIFNAQVIGYEVDAHWPGSTLIAELDSYEYHHTWQARERDLARDADLKLAGYDVIRITSRMLRDEPEKVVALVEGPPATGRPLSRDG